MKETAARWGFNLLVVLLFIGLAGINVAFAMPGGVDNITILDSQRREPGPGTQISAQGGNITTLSISTRSQTKNWQGFVGNITGSIILEDASNSSLYAWNLTNISGEIYASRNGTIDWSYISVQNDCEVDEELTGKGSDRVSKTFSPSANTVNFSVGTIQINSSTSCAVLPFVNNSKQKTTNLFENILLTRGTTPNGNQSIYVGILENGVHGYDGQVYNFQILVPVNKTSGFTTYYIYAEIE